jgi:hypothetical protein
MFESTGLGGRGRFGFVIESWWRVCLGARLSQICLAASRDHVSSLPHHRCHFRRGKHAEKPLLKVSSDLNVSDLEKESQAV